MMTMAACGSSEPQVKERDLPEGDYAELGEGTVYVSTPGGTSEDGNIPVIYVDKNTTEYPIGLNAWDFNGAALSFIYVDGMLLDKHQLADTQTSIYLGNDYLTVGIHTVEVVQYENDDPASSMITYKSMQYEAKEK